MTTEGEAHSATWHEEHVVDGYLGRVGNLAPRQAGEDVLREVLPPDPTSVLDLGCGDGRLAALVLDERPNIERAVCVDNSPPMLEHAAERFAGDERVELRSRDLAEPLGDLGRYDVVVSGFAIHHVSDVRKQQLYDELPQLLAPGGCFANLEVVQCATPALHADFLERIGRPHDDPEDRLVDVETQLSWLRAAGLRDVDCLWRWRGFALLVGWSSES
jgi:SAM-dependent methyltransferase